MRPCGAWPLGGDGWYGFNLDGPAAVRERVDTLERLCAERGRDRAGLGLSVALRDPGVGGIGALADAGVDELVLVEAPPDRPETAVGWFARWPRSGRGRLGRLRG
jgi:hypothetical protein